jgi:iron complex outermembrane receptor protein
MHLTGAWLLALVIGLAAVPAHAQDGATLTGTVVDGQNGETLIGANVALRESDAPEVVAGAATDTDGAFRFTDIAPGQYVLEVRFVGYQTQQRTLTLEAGETRDVTIELPLSTASLETVVVSASRRQEKILDAPASISVFQPEDIQSEVNTSTVDAIRSAPGVDMAQTGIDRREVVLRGFNEAFSGSAYVLTDYRESAVPSLGVNLHAIMPNMSVDVERIEVVRGPGSALYGPGVDSGVIHYFTKDPFDHPGTTVSVAGGTRQYFAGQFRNAGTFTDNFGWKITGQFARADEWELDPGDAPDRREIERYRVYQNRDQIPGGRNFSQGDFDDDGDQEFRLRREDLYQKFNVNGLLQYKAGDATTISLNGGYSELKGVVQSGIGTLQADGFGYAYGQLRVQSGGLFGQIYLNANDSGDDTYVYGSGDQTIDKGLQWNGQLQYDFDVSAIGTQVITGLDADLTIPRTEGRILGRNEEDDDIQEYGAYTQTTTDLSEKFELTLAGRLDYNNVVEELQVSPRAALVYKLTPSNTVRASYNRSFSSPGTNSLFLDIEALRQPLGNDRSLVFQGLGAADGYTFNDYFDDGTVRFSLPVPGFFKNDYSVGALPFYPMHAAVASRTVVQGPNGPVFSDQVSQLLDQQGLNDQQQATLATIFGLLAQNPGEFVVGGNQVTTSDASVQLGIPDDSERGYRTVNGPSNIPPLSQTTTQTFEIGYKGALADRFIVNVDAYFEEKEDFIGPLVVESPLAYLQQQGLTQDAAMALGQVFGTTSNQTIQALLGSLQQSGIPPEQAAGLLGAIIGNGLNNTPTAVVQPDQQVLPGGGNASEVGGMLSYRNFGQVQYWGVDISIQAQATDELSAFANVSIVSDDFFDNEELDETNTALSLALNAPSFKAKGGFNYSFANNGLSIGASSNYVQGFRVETGPYVGQVDDYFLIDANLGYEFENTVPGLSANLTVKNVLNNEHREFVGAPELGRFFMTRLTYTLP